MATLEYKCLHRLHGIACFSIEVAQLVNVDNIAEKHDFSQERYFRIPTDGRLYACTDIPGEQYCISVHFLG